MKALQYNEVSKDILKILDLVKNGEEIIIKDARNKENAAVIISYDKYKNQRQRPLGILKGKASFKLKDDFEITDEEFLSL